MKKFSILSILQICFCLILAIASTIQSVWSIIQCGHFEWWQLGFVAITIITYCLVAESVKEAEKLADK